MSKALNIMEVTPEQSGASSVDEGGNGARENLEMDIVKEATGRSPRRKRRPNWFHTRHSEKRTKSDEETDEDTDDVEDDEKPAAVRSFIGLKIQKDFGEENGGIFEGEVKSGPITKSGQRVWHIVYSDGDEEDMNRSELWKYLVKGQKLKPAEPAKIADTDETVEVVNVEDDQDDDNRRKSTRKKGPTYYVNYEDYQTALKELKYKMGVTDAEVKAALDTMNAPYGLNDVMHRIHEARKDPDTYVPRDKFVPQIGMRIKKCFDGTQVRKHELVDCSDVWDLTLV